MERYQKFISRMIIFLALLWLLLPLSTGYRVMYIGGLFLAIGIENMVFLNIAQKTGEMPKKIQFLIERHGHDKGIMLYAVFFVFAYLLVGLSVVTSGYYIQFQM